MIKKIVFLTLSIFSIAPVNAAPIEIVQTFYDPSPGITPFKINGIDQVVSGDWIFRGLTDTSAVDQNAGPIGSYAASVFLTQASLGLVDELVTNMNDLIVSSSVIGFSGGSGSPPATFTGGSFSDPNQFPLLSELTIAQNTNSSNRLSAFVAGLVLSNGTVIMRNSGLSNLESSVSFTEVSAVPVPGAVWLFGTALIGLVGFSKRRKVA